MGSRKSKWEINLLEETLKDMKHYKKKETDILWVGTESFATTWENFKEVAAGINYDNGYGIAEIRTDLVIVGDDWWLERFEYDGSETWVFKTKPVKPEGYKYIKSDDLLDKYQY